MELKDRTVLVLGGAGLVGFAVARRMVEHSPKRLIVTSLRRTEAQEAVGELKGKAGAGNTTIEAAWGDLFVQEDVCERPREDILGDSEARGRMVDDLFGPLTQEVLDRSALGSLLARARPDVIVDCVNTAGALAYQDTFHSAAELRATAETGVVDGEAVERHLSTMYLPQLIRHVQISLEGMIQAGTGIYVKVGTVGTGGMGLNIPFTHSEERPSRVLLAKSGLAGAHTLLLYLMARTPGAPAVKEVKPTAAISWRSIGFGPIMKGGSPLALSDSTGPLPVSEAFSDGAKGFKQLDEPLEGVYIDAGENGLFSLPEFEALTSLGLMEFVTPEEIAENVIREIQGHPTGRDVVSALDAATMGPTYRAGVLRSEALGAMERLEAQHGIESVAYEMLGPPRLSKLLFEAAILERLYDVMEAAAGLDPEEAAGRSRELIEQDTELRQRILTIGLPILLPDGEAVLRGADVKVPPEPDLGPTDDKIINAGWVDLRASNWSLWKDRITGVAVEIRNRPGVLEGSQGDQEFGDAEGRIRPGRMAAWIFRYEDKGERIKR
jgi:NAD(P)-dependent dehydrogenase (short-subunit alcohol dehydrogenase family)